MALNLNKVTLAGRLTRDPELRTTPSGVSFCKFGVAVNRQRSKEGQQPQADFINVSAWNKTAEFISKFFKKGNAICVTGSIQTGSYTDKNGQNQNTFEVVAEEAYFVESKAENGQFAPPTTAQNAPQAQDSAQGYQNPAAQQIPMQATYTAIAEDEELPF